MKTVTTTKIELEDGDIELLKKPLPEDPCDECHARTDGSCCGCPKERRYTQEIQPYVTAGILDFAISLANISKLLASISAFSYRIEELYRKLPDEIKSKVLSQEALSQDLLSKLHTIEKETLI